MAKAKRYDFTLDNNSIGNMAGIKYDQVLAFTRDGRFMPKQVASTTSDTLNCEIFSFQWKGEKDAFAFPSGISFTKVLSGGVGAANYIAFEVGTGINNDGIIYRLSGGNLVADVSFTTTLGDTGATVLAGLSFSLGLQGISNVISGNRITLTSSNVLVRSITASLERSDKFLYKSGLFAKIPRTLYGETVYDEYVISVSQSNTGYPAIPALDASYDINDLTYAGVYGVQQYLTEASYNLREYLTASIDNRNVSGAGTATLVPPPPGWVAIDDAGDRFILGSEVLAQERFEILYKV